MFFKPSSYPLLLLLLLYFLFELLFRPTCYSHASAFSEMNNSQYSELFELLPVYSLAVFNCLLLKRLGLGRLHATKSLVVLIQLCMLGEITLIKLIRVTSPSIIIISTYVILLLLILLLLLDPRIEFMTARFLFCFVLFGVFLNKSYHFLSFGIIHIEHNIKLFQSS